MSDLYQLGEGESVPYKLVPSKVLPNDKAVVFSHDKEAVIVQADLTPLPGTLASGHVTGGKKAASAVSIQGTITHLDGSTSTAVFMIDVGGGVPPAPKPKPPEEAIRAHRPLGPSLASKAGPVAGPDKVKTDG